MIEDKEKLLLDKNIYEELINVINSQPILNILTSKEISNKKSINNYFVLFYSFNLTIKNIVDEINSLKKIDKKSDLVNLINNIYNITDGIEKINNCISDFFKNYIEIPKIELEENNEEIFYYSIKCYFKDIIKSNNLEWDDSLDKEIKNDKICYEYLRALLIHPFDISKNRFIKKITKKYDFIEKQVTTKILLQNSFYTAFKNLSNNEHNDIFIRTCLINKKNDNNEYTLELSLDKIKKYAINEYNKISYLTILFKKIRQELINKLNREICLKKEDDLYFLKQIINEMDNKFLDNYYYFKELKNYYLAFKENKFNNSNKELIEEYFSEVISVIKKNIKKLENYDYNEQCDLYDIVSNLSRFPNEYNYELEKIYSHLTGERNGLKLKKFYDPSDKSITDKEWALYQAENVYKNFSSKYVKMNIYDSNLSFQEIKLLITISIFKHNKEK